MADEAAKTHLDSFVISLNLNPEEDWCTQYSISVSLIITERDSTFKRRPI
jgi:hypothetical protein